MSTATPLNLNESTEGMTFIEQPPPPEPVKYSAEIIKEEKNNNSNIKNNTMDSTPLADIMGPPVANEPMMMMAEDPRMIQSPVQTAAAPPPMQVPQQQQQQQQQQQKTNSFNLSDEQIQALFVGVCAIIAFSKPIQDKLANLVPRFVGDDGARSTTGLAVTGFVAALVFYFGQRMIVNQTSRM